jgi:hypothetical protein
LENYFRDTTARISTYIIPENEITNIIAEKDESQSIAPKDEIQGLKFTGLEQPLPFERARPMDQISEQEHEVR